MKSKIIFTAFICSLLIFTGCSSQTASSENGGAVTESHISSMVDVSQANESYTDSVQNEGDNSKSESSEDEKVESIKTDTETSSQITESDSAGDSSEYEVSAVEIESELSGHEEELAGHWDAKYILDADGNEVDGSVIYGQAYKQYGGEMNYDADGSFSTRMGASASEENETGTFTYNGGEDVELLYSNDTTVVCTRCQVNGEDAIAMPIDLFGDTFTVYFMR